MMKISNTKIELGLERSTADASFELINKSVWYKV